MRVFLAAFILILMAEPAQSGAWLKEKGNGFFSFGATLLLIDGEATPRLEQSAYAEYGLTPNLTLGVSSTRIKDLSLQTLIFARVPVKSWDNGARLASEIGLGFKETETVNSAFLSAGLSWGKGISRKDKSGWINIDTALQLEFGSSDIRLKIDATYGMDISDRMRFLAQGFVELADDANSITLAPGLILKPKKLKFEPVISFEHRLGARASSGIRLAFWRSF
jgi:hypothetical protein